MTFQQPHELGLTIPLRSIASRLCDALAVYFEMSAAVAENRDSKEKTQA